MSYSNGGVPAQQVPAWKRLGLKLKQPDAAASAGNSPTIGHPSTQQHQSKRKLDAPPTAANSSQGAKRPRTDDHAVGAASGQLKKQKFVTFADISAKQASDPKATRSTTPQKKSKGPAKKQPPAPTDIKPALEYLRHWKEARDTWKFNKNHQSSLIKYVFDTDRIPAANIDTFYEYIQDLQGFIRMRLRETALEVRAQDQSLGPKAFPEGTKDLDATQARYETILSRFIESQPTGTKRKRFAEPDYLASPEDGDVIIQRLVKRMRAELVLDVLSDGEETETTLTSSSAATTAANDNAVTTADTEKRAKLNNGVAGKRKRKLRTNMDDSSSSESDSDSDSDTSSSGSSSSGESDSDDDDEPATNPPGADYETSSSSSSSSDESDSGDESSEDDSNDD